MANSTYQRTEIDFWIEIPKYIFIWMMNTEVSTSAVYRMVEKTTHRLDIHLHSPKIPPETTTLHPLELSLRTIISCHQSEHYTDKLLYHGEGGGGRVVGNKGAQSFGRKSNYE